MGESLGGAIVVRLAADSPPRGLILQSTFSCLRDIADVHYPKLSWLVPRNNLDSTTRITAIGELDGRVVELTADDADLRRYHACHLRPSVSSVVQSG